MVDEAISLESVVLPDDPLFQEDSTFDPQLDAFNHEAYAQAIFEILKGSNPPLSIGLFGPWGIGKSTVANILFRIIDESKEHTLKPIYFNAWKYSGDSFRRQLLVEVARQVYEGDPNRDSKVLRLQQLNYTDVLKEEVPQGTVREIGQALKAAARTRIRLRELGVVRIAIAIVVVVVTAVIAYLASSASVFTDGLLVAVLALFLKIKFDELFIVEESQVFDPKLIFPEQFEREFNELVGEGGPLGKKRAVVVIDDIDRCEPSTVRDVLISIKGFLGDKNCYFLVPCDERSVIEVFQDPSQQKGYKDELLRKYFNVTIRMSPLMNTDLVDFANALSRKTRIPEQLIQMAILANCKDARKMKHFLNTLLVKYRIAKARQKRGYLPINIDDDLRGFAKAVLLEDLYPELFERISGTPSLYVTLERGVVGKNTDVLDKELGGDWRTKYPGLDTILERTRHITLDRVDILLALKATNVQARVPNSLELENAIVTGDTNAVDSLLRDIPEDKKPDLVELLLDLLKRSTDQFLRNAIATCLKVYAEQTLVDAASQRTRLGREAIEQLLDIDKAASGLQQTAAQVFGCAQDLQSDYLDRVLAKYKTEINALAQPTQDLAETINAYYTVRPDDSNLSLVLNEKFDNWVTTEQGLSTLAKLDVPPQQPQASAFPSKALLLKVVAQVTVDEKSSQLNVVKREILFKNWQDALAEPFSERLVAILTEAESDSDYSKRIEYVVHSVLEEARVIEASNSDQLWSLLQDAYSRISDPNARLEIEKAGSAFAVNRLNPAVKDVAATFVLEHLNEFADGEVRSMVEYLRKFEDAEHAALAKRVVEQVMQLAEGERDAPTARTIERLGLARDHSDILPNTSIRKFVLATLKVNDSAFDIWEPVILDYANSSESDLSGAIAEAILSLLPKPYSEPRRIRFLELFAKILPVVQEGSKLELLTKFFSLCSDQNEEVRRVSAPFIARIREAVNVQDFSNRVTALFHDVCDIGPAEIESYRITLDETLKQKEFFGEHEWNHLAALIKRLILHQEEPIQTYGLDLVEQVPPHEMNSHADILRELENLANAEGVQQKRAANLLESLTPG